MHILEYMGQERFVGGVKRLITLLVALNLVKNLDSVSQEVVDTIGSSSRELGITRVDSNRFSHFARHKTVNMKSKLSRCGEDGSFPRTVSGKMRRRRARHAASRFASGSSSSDRLKARNAISSTMSRCNSQTAK